MNENQRDSRWLTPLVVTGMTAASVGLLLWLTSPELSWDEADLLGNIARSFRHLWGSAPSVEALRRHFHGPMGIYLAKLGRDVLPAALGSFEVRTRLPTALVASFAVGLSYWLLRRVFETSRSAAFVGSGLLLFSVIRLEETNVIGPHHLMLVCALALLGFAYRFRDEASGRTAVRLGLLLGLGALTMTYVIPAAVCAVLALMLAGSQWIAWERPYLRISGWVLVALGTAALVLLIFWPPGVLKLRFAKDFGAFLVMGNHPTLVGDRIFEVTPRWAAFYWLLHLDAPILLVATGVISAAFYRAFRARSLSPRHVYLGFCVVFFVATALTAHLAGARNLLLAVGVACLATGGLYDEALGQRPRLRRFGAVAIVLLAAANLARASLSSSYTPFLATDGYRAFVTQAEARLRENTKAVVYGTPVLALYAREAGITPVWEVSELPWTTQTVPLPPDVKYVLIPAFIYEHMPPEHPMRRIVAEHWKVVWSFERPHVWDLRLFERPVAGP